MTTYTDSKAVSTKGGSGIWGHVTVSNTNQLEVE